MNCPRWMARYPLACLAADRSNQRTLQLGQTTMPKRRLLTDAQVEGLLALPADEPLLVRHWTLTGADLVAIERQRGEHDELGFALQLCAFRYPGRLL